jgi:hypothetical protein
VTTPPIPPPPVEYIVAIGSPTLHYEAIVRRGDDDGTLWYVGSFDKAIQFPTQAAAEEVAAMIRSMPIGDIYKVVVLPTYIGEPSPESDIRRRWWERALDWLGL